MAPREGGTAVAGHTIPRNQETPRAPEDTWGGRERHQRGRMEQGGVQETPGGPPIGAERGDRSGPQDHKDPTLKKGVP
jgi:hypothetical protein